MDIKCPGSKEQHSLRPDNIEKLTPRDECKFVVSDRDDFDWALRCIERHELSRRCTVLISPNLRTAAPADVAAWILESNAPVRLSLQLHTIIWGPDVRGV
jgi:7-carboxy-7-deazaguanine synthase